MSDAPLTTAQIAAHFHVKIGTIRNWTADGCPAERRGKGKPVLYDLDKVKQWRQSSSSSGANLDPQKEKALLDRARRMKVEAEVKVLKGRLIKVDEVEDHWSQLVAAARAKFLSLPHKLAPAVVACGSLREVEDEARTLINEALQELAGTGVPDHIDMEAATESDDIGVGRQVPEAVSGGECGAGAVEDGQSAVPEGDT